MKKGSGGERKVNNKSSGTIISPCGILFGCVCMQKKFRDHPYKDRNSIAMLQNSLSFVYHKEKKLQRAA